MSPAGTFSGDELHDLSALEQAAAIRSGQLSSVELTEHYLRRGERLGDTVGAYVMMTPELAMEQAEAADSRVRNAADGEPLPPLLGVVCPIKDLVFVAGIPTRAGSAVIDATLPTDDDVVANLRAAGLVITGKTNTPEMGLPCYTEPDVAPPARTPWDLTRSAGGSSGGAAAAVAAGLAPVAHGNDGGGSIRIPCAVTGLVGIKPSRGRVSNGPYGDIIGDLPTSGPIARSVADGAALLDVMAQPRYGSPFSIPPPRHGTFLAASRRDPGKLTIGYYLQPGLVQTNVHGDVRAAMEDTVGVLEGLGHTLVESQPPFDETARPAFFTIWSILALLTPVPPEREEDLRPLTRYLREAGRQVSGLELASAISFVRVAARFALQRTEHLDAVLCPTLAEPPALVGQLRDDDDPAGDFDAQIHYSPFCAPYNMTGQPAINVPMNWNADGLPIGVQLVGRSADEETIISLAAQLEATCGWLGLRPEIW
ncbi:MAG: amidase [Actinomycetes bacterium]